MAEIKWTSFALQNLIEIGEFIEKDSKRYAQITVDKLYSKVLILKDYPLLGRVVPEKNDETVRELIDGNYRIIYELSEPQINILTVHHSARDLRL